MKHGISAILVVHNEEKVVKGCLESIRNIADEILIIHDGPCEDKTIEICKKYTKNIFIRPRKKMVALHLKFLFEKVNYDWILKIDADEILSKDLAKNIRNLIESENADAYSFIWPFWDGKKETTKRWPRKMALYRISKISFLGFPHWDDPQINGRIVNTEFKLEHRTIGGSAPTWRSSIEKGIKKYLPVQAQATIKDFKEFDRFQYNRTNFPIQIRIRRKFPLITAIPFSILAFFKTFFTEEAWKEGTPAFEFALQSSIYYFILGLQVQRFKNELKQKE